MRSTAHKAVIGVAASYAGWPPRDGFHCIGAYSNFPGGNRPTDETEAKKDVTQAELDRLQQRNAELADHRGVWRHPGHTARWRWDMASTTRPAGLAAWIIDKFWAVE